MFAVNSPVLKSIHLLISVISTSKYVFCIVDKLSDIFCGKLVFAIIMFLLVAKSIISSSKFFSIILSSKFFSIILSSKFFSIILSSKFFSIIFCCNKVCLIFFCCNKVCLIFSCCNNVCLIFSCCNKVCLIFSCCNKVCVLVGLVVKYVENSYSCDKY